MALSIFELGWSWLPSELFSEIFDRLSVVDRIRCRCVCRSWRCAAQKKPILRPPPAESPWLMFRDPVKGCNFYSIAENKIYRMNDALSPEEADFSRRSWIGSSEGWLITADERSELHLVNPISRVEIPLPSILSLPCVTAVRDPEGLLTNYRFSDDVDLKHQGFDRSLEETRDYLFGKAVVKWWAVDYNITSWTVMLLFWPGPKLAYARSGDIVWTTVEEGRYYYDDLLLYDGLFYALDASDYSIQVWDTTTTGHAFLVRTITLEFEEFNHSRALYPYLAVSSSHIFMFRRERDIAEGEDIVEGEDMYRTLSFEVYLLDDNDGGALKWARVHSLEDKAIFIGINSCICLSTRDFPQLRGNCIYFADDHWEGAVHAREEARDIGVCCLEDGTIAPCYPGDMPKLNWPPPLWITPSLH